METPHSDAAALKPSALPYYPTEMNYVGEVVLEVCIYLEVYMHTRLYSFPNAPLADRYHAIP